MQESKQIDELRKGLIAWYDFKEGSKTLYVGREEEACCEHLKHVAASLRVGSPEETMDASFVREYKGAFDYIVCPYFCGSTIEAQDLLIVWNSLLNVNGICLTGVDNRLGIRYWCGDQPRTKMYSQSEWSDLFKNAGFGKMKFYSVFSNLENPSHIFADGYRSNEDIANRLFPAYDSPDTIYRKEEELYKDLIDNGMFHSMANAWMIEASLNEVVELSDILQVTSSMERNPEDAFLTIIRNDGTVIKKNAYREGTNRFKYMLEYAKDLTDHGIELVEMRITEDGLVMPRMDAPTGQLALKEALLRDRNRFLDMLDAFRDCVMHSSDIEMEDVRLGPIARYGYIDMVPLNSFYIDGKYIFFDQEFRMEHYPINAILARMIATFYSGNADFDRIIPREDLYRRYGILENRDTWYRMEMDFLRPLRNEEALRDYHARIRRDDGLVQRNRERMRFSADRYHTVFTEIFAGCEIKDVYVFGSGKYAERFMDWYGPIVDVKGILDNDKDRWGKCLYGTEIHSPEILMNIDPGTYKVIVCVKNHLPILHQLDEMEIEDYSVYDGRTVYPRKLRGDAVVDNNSGEKKPYHIGYISGTFDLFHQGHLNLLKRAKEKCDYLIVGVVTDEGVRRFKHVEPFIPFEERLEIVRSCKYVDEANAIPVEHRDIRSAYALYHFDCQFCGSDYLTDPVFQADKLWLEERGSELEILPYTESTSSSKIKRIIEEKLLSI